MCASVFEDEWVCMSLSVIVSEKQNNVGECMYESESVAASVSVNKCFFVCLFLTHTHNVCEYMRM